ncbi:D-2-hydroxyacid dehydrogenase [Alteribacter natronophilus]|uniref:D-2-hydroxyacid dehydrogenase n=1 Tax=Alteribacter natronophilus TaxID=2583810 RepID=UPI00110E8316|nr:D-2-hydroxyacid dehydrogenase [Alteribacter natronophilus]TMW70519.1 D-2-hydroxyacid dehydrogenase [Alteribacter natronophilus]
MTLVTTSADFQENLKNGLTGAFPEVTFTWHDTIEGTEQSGDLKKADILITYGEDLTPDHIRKAGNLKWIMVVSAGMEKMPFKAIGEKGILVTNARGIHATPMAEYAISVILQTARKAKELLSQERDQVWSRKLTMTELNGCTLGVLGAGAIGSETARLAKAFGMHTIGLNRSGRPADHFDETLTFSELDRILKNSDFLVSVLPHTEETAGLLTRDAFRKMKNNAVFINMGRGTVTKEEDLIEALTDRDLAHAVLDVFEQEPLPKGHPYWTMENVTVTPHISGISPGYQPRAIGIFEQNLKEFLGSGKNYHNKIDVSKGY